MIQTHAGQVPPCHTARLRTAARRVPFIDENADANESTAKSLEPLGCRVETVLDGPSRLVACRAFESHLIGAVYG